MWRGTWESKVQWLPIVLQSRLFCLLRLKHTLRPCGFSSCHVNGDALCAPPWSGQCSTQCQTPCRHCISCGSGVLHNVLLHHTGDAGRPPSQEKKPATWGHLPQVGGSRPAHVPWLPGRASTFLGNVRKYLARTSVHVTFLRQLEKRISTLIKILYQYPKLRSII